MGEHLTEGIKMTRSQALEWVKLGIEKGQYGNAIGILDSLIAQEKEYEKQEREQTDEEVV